MEKSEEYATPNYVKLESPPYPGHFNFICISFLSFPSFIFWFLELLVQSATDYQMDCMK